MANRLPKTMRTILGIGMAILAVTGAYWVATSPRRSKADQESLIVEPSDLDIGDVWENPTFEWTLPIENRSGKDVIIKEFEVSCALCVSVEPKSLIVPPHEKVKVRLTIDLTKSLDEENTTTGPERVFQMPIVAHVVDNGKIRRAIWGISGRVRSAIELTPRSIHLGELIRGQKCAPRICFVSPKTDIDVVNVQCPQELAATSVRKQIQKEKAIYEIEITPSARIPITGALKFQVMIQAVTREGERLPPVPLHLEGVVVEDVQASPNAIAFGVVPVGETREETIVLCSVSHKKFEVGMIEISAKDVKVERLENRVGFEKGFRLTQFVTQLEFQKTLIRFKQ